MKDKLNRLLLAAMWTTIFVLALLIADNLSNDNNTQSKGCSPCKAKKELIKRINKKQFNKKDNS